MTHFNSEHTAREMNTRGDKLGAIRLLRDRNAFLSLKDAKDVVESWGTLRELSPHDLRARFLAHALACQFYAGKLSTVPNLDARTARAMEEAAARENAERMFAGTARDLLEQLTPRELVAQES